MTAINSIDLGIFLTDILLPHGQLLTIIDGAASPI